MKQNVLITGAAGFIGTELTKVLIGKENFGQILGMDIRPSHVCEGMVNFKYQRMDIRDKSLEALIKENNIHVVVHLASIVSPNKMMTREFLYSVDVEGTKNVLEACVRSGVERFVVTSSGASYGYYADNPDWIVESDPLRGNPEFAYSDHKRLVEEMLAEYRERHPELKQLIFRPGTVLGEKVSNQITDLFEKKFVLGVKGSPTPFVFAWDEDLVAAIIKGIVEGKEGIYNVAGDGALTLKEIADLMGKPYIEIPYGVIYTVMTGLKVLKLTQYGPEQINFLRYRPVLSNKALKEGLGYLPGKTSKESFLCYLKAKNMCS